MIAIAIRHDAAIALVAASSISKEGDTWKLGRHRIVCGNALSAPPYHSLFGNDRAEMVVTDPPYNVKIQGHARGRSKKPHREFAMASGEMSQPGFMAERAFDWERR